MADFRQIAESLGWETSTFDYVFKDAYLTGRRVLSETESNIFLKTALESQVVVSEVRVDVDSDSEWSEPIIRFKNDEWDVSDASTRHFLVHTVSLRGEIPIDSKLMESQVQQRGFGSTAMLASAEATGREIEHLAINSDMNSVTEDRTLQNFDGWLKQAKGGRGNVYDAVNIGHDYQSMFSRLLQLLPDRYKRDKANMRFYVPMSLEERYRDQLAQRGTALGDAILEGSRGIKYQEIPIKPVPFMDSGIDSHHIILTHKLNLQLGVQSQVIVDVEYDTESEFYTVSFSLNLGVNVVHVPATAIAINVSV